MMNISESQKVAMLAYIFDDILPRHPKSYFIAGRGGPRKVFYMLKDLDTSTINLLEQEVDVSSTASLQQALLEVLAVTMKTTQRLELGMGPSYPWKYRKRCPMRVGEFRMERRMTRAWYKRTSEGRREHVDGIFQVISRDPEAFLQMVGHS